MKWSSSECGAQVDDSIRQVGACGGWAYKAGCWPAGDLEKASAAGAVPPPPQVDLRRIMAKGNMGAGAGAGVEGAPD